MVGPLPQRSLSGTSLSVLYDDNSAIREACEDLKNAIRRAWPNGRDYSASDLAVAVAEWEHHLMAVDAIDHHALAIMEWTADMKDAGR